MKNKICITEKCGETSTPRTDRCINCNAVVNRWKHRKPLEILGRQQFLIKSSDRMTQVQDEPKKKEVHRGNRKAVHA